MIRRTRLLTAAGGELRGVRQRQAGQPVRRQYAHGAPRDRRRAGTLVAGRNILAVAVADASPRPAGLAGKLVIEFEGHEPLVCRIDASWKVSAGAAANWNAPDFDDSHWPAAVSIAKTGDKSRDMIAVPGANDPPLACPLLAQGVPRRGRGPPGHGLRQRAGASTVSGSTAGRWATTTSPPAGPTTRSGSTIRPTT